MNYIYFLFGNIVEILHFFLNINIWMLFIIGYIQWKIFSIDFILDILLLRRRDFILEW